jgi:FKBP12-rapamycin complex-associated protein
MLIHLSLQNSNRQQDERAAGTAESKEVQKAGTEPAGGSSASKESVAQEQEYGSSAALSALVKILKEQSLSNHHTTVVQAIMYIVRMLGLRSIPYLPMVSISETFSL